MESVGRERKYHMSSGFTPHHHPLTRGAQERLLSLWSQKTASPGGHRCKGCWLNLRSCYCSYLNQRRLVYNVRRGSGSKIESAVDDWEQTCSLTSSSSSSSSPSPPPLPSPQHVEFVIYYHYRELGRSANTAHLLESLFDIETIIFGDSDKEIAMAEQLKEEYIEGRRRTVILYPSKDAKGLDEWMLENGERGIGDKSCNSFDSISEYDRRALRIVLLDGTYSDASMMARHLEQLLTTYSVPCPLVKLDLEDGMCRSAYVGFLLVASYPLTTPKVNGNKSKWRLTLPIGIMYQPNPEKICTLQAGILAARQAARSAADHRFCDMLNEDLELWIEYILTQKIKTGKAQPKRANKLTTDFVPSEKVLSYLKENPPPVGVLKMKGTGSLYGMCPNFIVANVSTVLSRYLQIFSFNRGL